MLIDSGANINLISLKAAERLKGVPRFPTKQIIKVASGDCISASEAMSVDIKIGNGTKKDVKVIICNIAHDLILGFKSWKKLHMDEDREFIQIDHCWTEYPKYGNTGICTALEDIVLEPSSSHLVHIYNPTGAFDKIEPITRMENLEKGFLFENGLNITEGIHTNKEYLAVEIHNPWATDITVPKGAELAKSISMVQKAGKLQCNQLVQIISETERKKFYEHKTLRHRRFRPDLSDIYKEVEVGQNITKDQKLKITKLLEENKEAFSTCEDDIGLIKDHKFAINLKDEEKSIYIKPRPTPPAYVKQGRESIQNWKNTRVIEEASSSHNIPLFFIPKKGGAVRPVLDCRWLNEETVPNRYPIPSLKSLLSGISELIGSNKGKEIFISCTDIQAAFNQLEVVEKDRPKCAFSWEGQQYQAVRTLFGLRNAPSAFSEVMVKVTSGIPGCFVLLDDVLLIATSFEEHQEQIKKLLQSCMEWGITLKPSKTHICKDEIDYLGFKLSKDGIEPLKSKVDPILNYPAPTTRKQMRRFVGMCVFYARFVRDGHRLLAPLFKMCGKSSAPFEWKQEQADAFKNYKKSLSNFVLLKHRDPKKPLVLITDGSEVGIAGGLHQKLEDGTLEPLGFVSRALMNNEKGMPSRYIEFMAICYCLDQFQWEVRGQHVLILTDHKSLEQVTKEKEYKENDTRPLIVRNAHQRLHRFDISISHRPNTYEGIIAIDALSRVTKFEKPEEPADLEDLRVDRGVSNHIEAEEQKFSPTWRILPPHVPTTVVPHCFNSIVADSDKTIPCIKLRDFAKKPIDDVGNIIENLEFSFEQITKMQEEDEFIQNEIKSDAVKKNNKGVYIKTGSEWAKNVLLIPNVIKRELVSFLHIAHGHPGIDRLRSIIRREFSIYKLNETMADVIKHCHDCIITKPRPSGKHPKPPVPDHGIQPWERYYIDLADFGSADKFGNRYILGIEDELSRYIDVVPIPDKQAETVAVALANLLLRHNALCGKMIQDNGLEFNNQTHKKLHELFNIAVSRISPYYPRGNKIERRWREIGIQAKLQQLDKNTWSRDIMLVIYHVNNLPCSNTEYYTPCEILTGRQLKLPCFPATVNTEGFDEYSWVGHLSEWLYKIGTHLTKKQLENPKSPPIPNKRDIVYEIRYKAAIWCPQRVGVSKKLYRQFHSGATIKKNIGNGCYQVEDVHKRIFIRNTKHLRKLPDTT